MALNPGTILAHMEYTRETISVAHLVSKAAPDDVALILPYFSSQWAR